MAAGLWECDQVRAIYKRERSSEQMRPSVRDMYGYSILPADNSEV